jgi:hypothetical protein
MSLFGLFAIIYLHSKQEEEKPQCKTPNEWRITPEIRHEFVANMRTVALLSMYSKVSLTRTCSLFDCSDKVCRITSLSARQRRL